jgi:hypothetical protein
MCTSQQKYTQINSYENEVNELDEVLNFSQMYCKRMSGWEK